MLLSASVVAGLILEAVLYQLYPANNERELRKTLWQLSLRVGAIVLVISAAVVALVLFREEPNFFRVLNVPRDATRSQIKTAFKRFSLTNHPDKTNAPGAEENFIKMREVYDSLLNDQDRSMYDRFGPEALTLTFDETTNFMIMDMLPTYIGLCLMCFIRCSSVSNLRARTTCLVLVAGAFLYEVLLKFDRGYDFLSVFLPYTTIFEQVYIMRVFVLLSVQAMAYVARITYIDVDALRHKRLVEMLNVVVEMLDAAPFVKNLAEQRSKDAEGEGSAGQSAFVRHKKAMRKSNRDAPQVVQRQGGMNLGQIFFMIYIVIQIYSMFASGK